MPGFEEGGGGAGGSGGRGRCGGRYNMKKGRGSGRGSRRGRDRGGDCKQKQGGSDVEDQHYSPPKYAKLNSIRSLSSSHVVLLVRINKAQG